MKIEVSTSAAPEVRIKYHSGGHYKKSSDRAIEQRNTKLSLIRHKEIALHQHSYALKNCGSDVVERYDEADGVLRDYSVSDLLGDLERESAKLDNLHKFHQNVSVRKVRSWKQANRPTKLTRSARATIYEAGCILDGYYKGNTYLTTCTLPGSDGSLYELLANESGYIIDRLNKAIKKYGCLSYFVWEWQKRGALHLHYATADYNVQNARNAAFTIEYEWFELLLELGEKYGKDFFVSPNAPHGTWLHTPSRWQSKVELVVKSVARYLSKYLSKAVSGSDMKFAYPSAWWGMSRTLRRAVEEHRVTVVFEGTSNLLETLFCNHVDLFRSLGSSSEFAYYFEKAAGSGRLSPSSLDGHHGSSDTSGHQRLLFWGHCSILHYDSTRWLAQRHEVAELLKSDYLWSWANEVADSIGELHPWKPRQLYLF